MRLWLIRLSRDDSAATAVEYAVLLALILVVVIVAIDSLGSTSSGMWASDTSRITSAVGGRLERLFSLQRKPVVSSWSRARDGAGSQVGKLAPTGLSSGWKPDTGAAASPGGLRIATIAVMTNGLILHPTAATNSRAGRRIPMKLKRLPEDFQVEELTTARPGGPGPVHASTD